MQNTEQKNEIVVDNKFNNISMNQWTAKEMDLFMGIIAKMTNQKRTVVEFDTNELRKIIKGERNADRWKQTMITVVNRMANLRYYNHSDKSYKLILAFSEFDLEFDKKKLTVQVSENFESFVNVILKEGEFTFYELEEFVKIKSTYAKQMYRHLKQWRTMGKVTFSIERLRAVLDVPRKYTSGEVTRRVVNPIVKELRNYFKNLKCDVIKEKTRGNPVKEYVFTFERDTSLPYQGQAESIEKNKKATANTGNNSSSKRSKTNVPNWSKENYENTTTPEKQAEMAFQKSLLLQKIEGKE